VIDSLPAPLTGSLAPPDGRTPILCGERNRFPEVVLEGEDSQRYENIEIPPFREFGIDIHSVAVNRERPNVRVP
jgi:hypothetical protein